MARAGDYRNGGFRSIDNFYTRYRSITVCIYAILEVGNIYTRYFRILPRQCRMLD